jgi:hypothetical protein
MTERELLEAAAKAAGMETKWEQGRGAKTGWLRARVPDSGMAFPVWNPLTDDGDAFRLAVKLRLWSCDCGDVAHAGKWNDQTPLAEVPSGLAGTCAYEATRRAIVLAAAASVLKPTGRG